MYLEEYISAIEKTKTYKAGLITYQKYTFKTWLLGIKTLPKIPVADDNRHIIVMKIIGDQPIIHTVLDDPKHSIQTTTKDADALLFIFVEMRKHSFVIDGPKDGYRLNDGHQISAKFTVKYKIQDAEEFWKESEDPLAELEIAIINAAKNYFLTIPSAFLVGYTADSKKEVERHIQESSEEISTVKNNVELKIKTSAIAGLTIENVIADIHIGESLYEYLKRIHGKIYDTGGAAERFKIDQIIDKDKTFAPYDLRTVINAVDLRLLENFHTKNWSEAMSEVTKKVAEQKEKYLEAINQNEFRKMEQLVGFADKLNIDPMHKEELKEKIGSKLLSMADENADIGNISDNEYLAKILSPPPSAKLLNFKFKKGES